MHEELNIKSYAKINLTLDVLRRRADGYHEVKMIMQTIKLHDEVRVSKKENGIELHTNVFYIPTDERNLAFRAAQLFFEKTGIKGGTHIILKKNIPVAAGLAGGSGNAAAVLCALNRLYHAGLTADELAEIGVEIGADVPYCIVGGTMLAEGIGEKLTVLSPMPHCFAVLVKPELSVSTKKVYEALDMRKIREHPDTNGVIVALKTGNKKEIAIRMYNVLQQVTEQMHPEIAKIRSRLLGYGAAGAIMSGSGPTVFGLFEQKETAERAYRAMRQCYPETFLTETVTEGENIER